MKGESDGFFYCDWWVISFCFVYLSCAIHYSFVIFKDEEFGGYMIQQNVGGHPVAVYRFPPRIRFNANTVITVYSGMNDHILHQPPTDFVWKEQFKWGTGPECTSILCKPNGQVKYFLEIFWFVARFEDHVARWWDNATVGHPCLPEQPGCSA